MRLSGVPLQSITIDGKFHFGTEVIVMLDFILGLFYKWEW